MSKKPETVVLLHGILRTDSCMNYLAKQLEKEDYNTLNIRYPYSKMNIEDLAEKVLKKKLKEIPKETIIHFVTHSMGGIVTRAYLNKHLPKNLGKVIMLTPPNQGSEVTDFLKKYSAINWIFKKICGEAGQQLGTDKNSFTSKHSKDKINFTLGVIAGNYSIIPLSLAIKSTNDGLVSIKSTKIKGMTDHITIPIEHMFAMYRKETIKQVIHFLKNSRFNKEDLS